MSDGALLDLIARGKKDTYFIQNDVSTKSWFKGSYQRRSPSARVIQTEYPTAPARFNNWADIPLPITGDVLLSADIRIQMPSWLPASIVALNTKQNVIKVQGQDGNFYRYGWTNGIANFLIQRWALYMDNIEIQQGWGDYNDWNADSETTHLQAPLIHASTGTHDGTAVSIQLNASPQEVLFRVPIAGCQSRTDTGLPLIALRNHRLFIRIWLLDKTVLVESEQTNTGSPPEYESCPAPWGSKPIQVLDNSGNQILSVSGERTVAEYNLGNPVVYGRFTILHLDSEMREIMRTIPHSIRYKQQNREDFTIANVDWPTQSQQISRFTKRVELLGLYQRLLLSFRSYARVRQNKYRDITPTGNGEWLNRLSVIINGAERILPWAPKIMRTLSQNLQLERDVSRALYFLIFGVSPDSEPAGPILLAQTNKVLLTMELAYIPLDPQFPTRQTFVSITGESWNIMDIQEGIASVRFTT
jgi:hypothetical protein